MQACEREGRTVLQCWPLILLYKLHTHTQTALRKEIASHTPTYMYVQENCQKGTKDFDAQKYAKKTTFKVWQLLGNGMCVP